MKTISRMSSPRVGRICLVVFLCLLAGCWGTDSKQEASKHSAAAEDTASSSQPAEKAVGTGRTDKPRADSPDESLGFEHTLKPRTAPQAKPAAAAAAVDSRRGDEEDRYKERGPSAIVGKQAEASKTLAPDPQASGLRAEKLQAGPSTAVGAPARGSASALQPSAIVTPASSSSGEIPRAPGILPSAAQASNSSPTTSDAAPTGNPLRDSSTTADGGRPVPTPLPATKPEVGVTATENQGVPASGPPVAQK
jgi:hypothetical protein